MTEPLSLKDDRLAGVFKFLEQNRRYNRALQNNTYRSWFHGCTGIAEQLPALLFHCGNMQSKSKLDKLSACWQAVQQSRAKIADIQSVTDLVSFISGTLPKKNAKREIDSSGDEFERLWVSLKQVRGWGEKTAALFVKALVEIHSDNQNTDLKFLAGFQISNETLLHVPVDTVIKHIFRSHLTENKKLSFTNINGVLRDSSEGYRDSLIWDDMWFWGFVTQRVEKKVRRTEINMPKYWSLWNAPWDSSAQVEEKAVEFIHKLNRCSDARAQPPA